MKELRDASAPENTVRDDQTCQKVEWRTWRTVKQQLKPEFWRNAESKWLTREVSGHQHGSQDSALRGESKSKSTERKTEVKKRVGVGESVLTGTNVLNVTRI